MKKAKSPSKKKRLLLTLLGLIIAGWFVSSQFKSPEAPATVVAVDDWQPLTGELLRKQFKREKEMAAVAALESPTDAAEYTQLTPYPMQISTKVLSQKRWNDGEQAFGREVGHEAATIGPAAVTYDGKGNVCVL